LENWHTKQALPPKTCILKKFKGFHPMIEFPTLQSKDGTMLVGFYPIEDCSDYTLKVLAWKGVDTISRKCISKKDAIREIDERLALDYLITGDNIDLVQEYDFMQGAV
jgi:hypothetical protein